jgi:hypothetical protein
MAGEELGLIIDGEEGNYAELVEILNRFIRFERVLGLDEPDECGCCPRKVQVMKAVEFLDVLGQGNHDLGSPFDEDNKDLEREFLEYFELEHQKFMNELETEQ